MVKKKIVSETESTINIFFLMRCFNLVKPFVLSAMARRKYHSSG